MPSSWQAILRRPSGELSNVHGLEMSGSGVDTVLSSKGINHQATMVCYCCCPLPYDSTFSTWVAVFTVPVLPGCQPMHVKDLQFPLFLPLYPLQDIVIMAFQAKRVSTANAPAAVFLHFPSEAVLRPMHPVNLTVDRWKKAESTWASAVKSLSTGSWLSYAFDELWALQGKLEDVGEDDFVVEEVDEDDGATDLKVTPMESDKDDDEDISGEDEDMEEDEGEEEEALDVCTGLVQAKGDVIVSSEEEFEEDDEEFEEDDEEEEDEEDKEEGED